MTKIYLQLMWSFMKIGALTFGGGYSMLPMLKREAVEKRGWCTEEELMDYFAVSQCIPGLIACNTAVFIGKKRAGTAGAAAAAFGVILPSYVIIVLIASFLSGFADIPAVGHAFAGIRVAVTALIIVSVAGLWKKGVKDVFGLVLFILSAAAIIFFSVSPAICIAIGIVCGAVRGAFERRRERS